MELFITSFYANISLLRSKISLFFILFSGTVFSQVAIIESQSFHPLQTMDIAWQEMVECMGYDSSILPQSALNNLSNLDSYDFLIVSSGLIPTTDNQKNTVEAFLQSGRSVYLQSEFSVTHSGNINFAQIVNNNGGSFQWLGALSGNIAPIVVLPPFSIGTGQVDMLSYFWWGTYGQGGPTVHPFLKAQNKYLGFVFESPNPDHGLLITTTDQDWVRIRHSDILIKNIFLQLTLNRGEISPIVAIEQTLSPTCIGDLFEFTANITDSIPEVTLQWQINGIPVPDADQAIFSVSNLSYNDVIECLIGLSNNQNYSLISNPIIIDDVFDAPPIFNETATNITVEATNLDVCTNDEYQPVLSAEDPCSNFPANITYSRNDGQNISAPWPEGITTVTATARGQSGVTTEVLWNVEVLACPDVCSDGTVPTFSTFLNTNGNNSQFILQDILAASNGEFVSVGYSIESQISSKLIFHRQENNGNTIATTLNYSLGNQSNNYLPFFSRGLILRDAFIEEAYDGNGSSIGYYIATSVFYQNTTIDALVILVDHFGNEVWTNHLNLPTTNEAVRGLTSLPGGNPVLILDKSNAANADHHLSIWIRGLNATIDFSLLGLNTDVNEFRPTCVTKISNSQYPDMAYAIGGQWRTDGEEHIGVYLLDDSFDHQGTFIYNLLPTVNVESVVPTSIISSDDSITVHGYHEAALNNPASFGFSFIPVETSSSLLGSELIWGKEYYYPVGSFLSDGILLSDSKQNENNEYVSTGVFQLNDEIDLPFLMKTNNIGELELINFYGENSSGSDFGNTTLSGSLDLTQDNGYILQGTFVNNDLGEQQLWTGKVDEAGGLENCDCFLNSDVLVKDLSPGFSFLDYGEKTFSQSLLLSPNLTPGTGNLSSTACSLPAEDLLCQMDSCNIDTLFLNTGYDPFNDILNPIGSYDNVWTLVISPNPTLNLPLPASVIFPNPAWGSQPNTNWISAYPENSLNENNASPLQPYTFENCFCTCGETEEVSINFSLFSDDSMYVNLVNEDGTLIQNLLAHRGHRGVSGSSSTTHILAEGRYCLSAELRNIGGVAMGFNLNGYVSGASVTEAACCSNGNGTIVGTKYRDRNCSGTRDGSNNVNSASHEEGLEDWQIVLCDVNQVIIDSVRTDDFGYFVFNEVPPGNYIVKEIQQPNWEATNDISLNGYQISISSNQIIGDIDFANKYNGPIELLSEFNCAVKGEEFPIKWDGPDCTCDIMIGYGPCDSQSQTNIITSATNNSGSYTWIVPEDFVEGEYKIYIEACNGSESVSSQCFKVIDFNVDIEIVEFECTSEYTFNITSNLAANYNWDFGDATVGEGNYVVHSYDPGTYEVRVTATTPIDRCMLTKSFSITPNENNLPPLCYNEPYINAVGDLASGGAFVEFDPPTIVDICNPFLSIDCNFNSGDFFPCGITEVVCTGTNLDGEFATCSLFIDVSCNDCTAEFSWTNPSCHDGQLFMISEDFEPDASVVWTFGNYVSEGATLADALAIFTFFEPGIYPVCGVVSDANCSVEVCEDIIIEDLPAPEIRNCPSSSTREVDPESCEKVTYFVMDLYDPCSPGNGILELNPIDEIPGFTVVWTRSDNRPITDPYQIGTTTITLEVFGSTGSDICEWTYTLVDNIPPVFVECPSDIVVEPNLGDSLAAIFIPLPEAMDNCPEVTIDCNFSSQQTWPCGETMATCIATDASGNTVECSFVVDVTCPQVNNEYCGQAAITCFPGYGNGDLLNNPVLGIVDVRDRSSATPGSLWTEAGGNNIYHPSNWNAENLGLVFGLAIGGDNKIYTSSSTVFGCEESNFNPFGPAGPAGVYKVDPISGDIEIFITTDIDGSFSPGTNQIPNTGAGLGNICYDRDHDQFFVTNFSDGMIYRISSLGIVLDRFDPFTSNNIPSDDNANFVILGERPWGIGYNHIDNKLYFGNWRQDRLRRDPEVLNEIWSLELNPSGSFIGTGTNGTFIGGDQKKFDVPDHIDYTLPNIYFDYSNPVSDISFSETGNMLIAERSMYSDCGTNVFLNGNFPQFYAHNARVLEYYFSSINDSWQLSAGHSPQSNGIDFLDYNTDLKFSIGIFSLSGANISGTNSAGGIDYGYDSFIGDITDPESSFCDAMVWSSSDYMQNNCQGSNRYYGLQGLNANGGNQCDSYIIDYDGIPGTSNKNQQGDVEIFRCFGCPAASCDIDVAAIDTSCIQKIYFINNHNGLSESAHVYWTVDGLWAFSGGLNDPFSFSNYPDGSYTICAAASDGNCDTQVCTEATIGCTPCQSPSFLKLYGDDINNFTTKIEQHDNSLFALGYRTTSDPNVSATFTRLNLDGSIVWNVQLPSSYRMYDFIKSQDGFILVGGRRPFGSSANSLICKIDFAGNLAWSKEYSFGGRESLTKILPASDPSQTVTEFYALGILLQGGDDQILLKIDEDGTELSYKRLDYTDDQLQSGFLQLSNGDYVMMGSTGNSAQLGRITADGSAAFYASDGTNGHKLFDGVEVNGKVYLVGQTASSGYLLVLNSSGTEKIARYTLPNTRAAYRIQADDNGSLYLSVTSNDPATLDMPLVYKLTESFSTGISTHLSIEWIKAIENNDSPLGFANITVTDDQKLIYADNRFDVPGGFGDYDVMMGVFDLNMGGQCLIDNFTHSIFGPVLISENINAAFTVTDQPFPTSASFSLFTEFEYLCTPVECEPVPCNTEPCQEFIVFTNCPSFILLPPSPGECEAFFDCSSIIAIDTCTNEEVSVNCSRSDGLNSDAPFPFGDTQIIASAFNNSTGEFVSCEIIVRVEDNLAPVVITCPVDTTLCALPNGNLYAFGLPAFGDNCTDEAELAIICSHQPGGLFPVGTTSVTCTATDLYGNISEPCVFEVTIEDCPTNCCEDIGSFNERFDQGFTVSNDGCNLFILPTGLEDCDIITVDWGDDFSNTGEGSELLSHNYGSNISSEYTITYQVFMYELDGTVCVARDSVFTVCIECSDCENPLLEKVWTKSIGDYDLNIIGSVGPNLATGNAYNFMGLATNGSDVFVSGNFLNTAEFTSATSGASKNLISNGGADLFFAKFDSNGNLIEALSAGGNLREVATEIELDGMGNIYIGGSFESESLSLPSISANSISPLINSTPGDNDIFIAKYNSNFELLWAKSYGTTGGETIWDMTVSDAGEIGICGRYFNYQLNFENFALPPGNQNAGYVAKFDTNGTPLWAFELRSPAPEDFDGRVEVTALDFDQNGNLYVASAFGGELNIDPIGGSTMLYNCSDGDACKHAIIAQYDSSNGHLNWHQVIGEESEENTVVPHSITEHEGKIYLSGVIISPEEYINFAAAGQTDIIINLDGSYNSFLVKVDANAGNFDWAHILNTNGRTLGVGVDNDGNPAIVGGFFSAGIGTDFDPDPDSTFILSSASLDGYVAKFNADGEFITAFNLLGTSMDGEGLHEVVFDNDNNIITIGFHGSNDLDDDPSPDNTDFLYAGEIEDIFIGKYACSCSPVEGTCCEEPSSFIVAAESPELDDCCFALNIQNDFGVSMTSMELHLNTDGWNIDQSIIAEGYQILSTSDELISITHSSGVIPSGFQEGVISFCLNALDEGAPLEQQVEVIWVSPAFPTDSLGQMYCNDLHPVSSTCNDLPCIDFMSSADPTCIEGTSNEYEFNFSITNRGLVDASAIVLNSQHPNFTMIDCNSPLNTSYANITLPLPGNLAPGATSENLCISIISAEPLWEITELCLTASLEGTGTELCCIETTPYCLTIEPCCTPCESGSVVSEQMLTDTTGCCHQLDINNECYPEFFTRLELEILTEDVQFSNFQNGDPENWNFTLPDNTNTIVNWNPNGNFIPVDNYEDLISFCLGGVEVEAETQQVLLSWYINDPNSTSGEEIVFCSETLDYECQVFDDLNCATVWYDSISCDTTTGIYELTFSVENTSNPEFDMELVQLIWSQEIAFVSPNPIVVSTTSPDFEQLQPGEIGQYTVQIVPNIFPFPESSFEFELLFKDDFGVACCNKFEHLSVPLTSCTDSNSGSIGIGITVFPNPFSDRFTILFERPLLENFQLRLFDIYGRELKSRKIEVGNTELTLEAEDLSPGIYFLELENANGNRLIEKLINH